MNPEKASPLTAQPDSTGKDRMHRGAVLHHAAPTQPIPGSRPIAEPRSAATPTQNAQIAIPHIDPMNPETDKKPASTFPRINPLNPEPGAFPIPTH